MRAAELLICDLDGTLLDRAGVVASGVPEALAGLQEAGLLFAVCTGRPYMAARRLLHAAGLHPALLAAYHGGLVADLGRRVCVRHLRLPARAAAPAADVLAAHGLTLTFYQGVWRRASGGPDGPTRRLDGAVAPGGPPASAAGRIGGVLSGSPTPAAGRRAGPPPGPATRIIAMGVESDVEAALVAVEEINDGVLRVERPAPTRLDLRHRLATKGEALRFLARLAGVPPQAVVAIGDDAGDVPMFALAGRAVLVGSAGDPLARMTHTVVGWEELAGYLRSLAPAAERRRQAGGRATVEPS